MGTSTSGTAPTALPSLAGSSCASFGEMGAGRAQGSRSPRSGARAALGRGRGDDAGLASHHHRPLEAADAAGGRALRGAAQGGGRPNVACEMAPAPQISPNCRPMGWGPVGTTRCRPPQCLQQSAFPAALSLRFKQEGKTQNISKCYLALQGQGGKKPQRVLSVHPLHQPPSPSQTQLYPGRLLRGPVWEPPLPKTRSQRFFSFFSPNFCAPKCCRAARTSPSITPRVGTPLPAHRLRSPHGHGFSSPVCWGGCGVPVCSGGLWGPHPCRRGRRWAPLRPSTRLPLQVEAWDSAVRAGHPLQSDTHYVFQARCRRSPPNSPWSAWSPPFMYTTPEAGKCPVCCEPRVM